MQSANIPNAIIAALILILITLGFAALSSILFSLVYRLSAIFYKWLSQRAFFIRLQQRRQEWWSRHKVSATWWWESTAIVLIDPVFYGYALVTLVQRLQAIQEYGQTYPQYGFWQLLDLDLSTHMQYYIALAVIFLIWTYWKIYQHSHAIRAERNVNTKLDNLLDANKELRDSIEKLVEEMRNDREAKYGK